MCYFIYYLVFLENLNVLIKFHFKNNITSNFYKCIYTRFQFFFCQLIVKNVQYDDDRL